MGSDDKLGSDVLDFEQTAHSQRQPFFFLFLLIPLLFPHFSFLFLSSSVFFLQLRSFFASYLYEFFFYHHG